MKSSSASGSTSSSSSSSSWDESCIIILTQTREGRQLAIDPKVRMVCLNKRGRPSAPTSSSSIVARPLSSSSIQPSSNSDNLNWQLVTATDLDDMLAQIRAMSREDEDGSGRSENNVGKDNDEVVRESSSSSSASSSSSISSTNISHHKKYNNTNRRSMPPPTTADPTSSLPSSSIQTYDITEAVNESVGQGKSYLTRIIRPHANFYSQYAASFSNGIQTRFFSGVFDRMIIKGDVFTFAHKMADKWVGLVQGVTGWKSSADENDKKKK